MASDVLHLIDMLYEMIDEAKGATFSSDKCVISRNEVLDMLGEIRAQLPSELQKAQQLIRARDDYVEAAKREADAKAQSSASASGGITITGEGDPDIDALVLRRAEAKKAKDFAEADRIRDELKAQGIEVTDTKDGASWKRV